MVDQLDRQQHWDSGFAVEFADQFEMRPEIEHVLFDFDGTLSLIRQGWPEVMVPMFVEALPRQEGETASAVKQLAFSDIMRSMASKPSIR